MRTFKAILLAAAMLLILAGTAQAQHRGGSYGGNRGGQSHASPSYRGQYHAAPSYRGGGQHYAPRPNYGGRGGAYGYQHRYYPSHPNYGWNHYYPRHHYHPRYYTRYRYYYGYPYYYGGYWGGWPYFSFYYGAPYYGYGGSYYYQNDGSAAQWGYRDGLDAGRSDAVNGHSYRPYEWEAYRDADHGMSLNPYGGYREEYRRAFLDGYSRGYNGG